MPVSRQKKQQIVKQLKEKMAESQVLLLADFTGLSVKELKELRARLKEVGAEFRVVKKTLFRLASQETSQALSDFLAGLKGAIGVVFGRGDEVGASKALWEFGQKQSRIKILAGFFAGRLQLAAVIEELAKLPSLVELRTKLIGIMANPASRLLNVFQGNSLKLCYILRHKGQS